MSTSTAVFLVAALLTAAAALISEFNEPAPTLAILKHTNPCGLGQGASLRLGGLPSRHDYEVPTAAVVDFLVRQPDVDADRVGVLGHSEGGAYIASIAANDPDVAFVVGLAPMVRPGLELLVDQTYAIARSQGLTEEEAQTSGFQFLLRAATSPTTAPLLNVAIQERYFEPISNWLGGEDAEIRARVLAATLIGFLVERLIRDKPLQRSDGDTRELLIEETALLAVEFMLADAAANAREWVRFLNYLERAIVVALSHFLDERFDVRMDRARVHALGIPALKAPQRFGLRHVHAESEGNLLVIRSPLTGFADRQDLPGDFVVPFADRRWWRCWGCRFDGWVIGHERWTPSGTTSNPTTSGKWLILLNNAAGGGATDSLCRGLANHRRFGVPHHPVEVGRVQGPKHTPVC